jgi:hypothetical protein
LVLAPLSRIGNLEATHHGFACNKHPFLLTESPSFGKVREGLALAACPSTDNDSALMFGPLLSF